MLAMALAELASISERRVDRMLDPAFSRGLPPFLAPDAGTNSGFMLASTRRLLVSENKVLAHPASVDTIRLRGKQEDHVSWAGPVRSSRVVVHARRVRQHLVSRDQGGGGVLGEHEPELCPRQAQEGRQAAGERRVSIGPPDARLMLASSANAIASMSARREGSRGSSRGHHLAVRTTRVLSTTAASSMSSTRRACASTSRTARAPRRAAHA